VCVVVQGVVVLMGASIRSFVQVSDASQIGGTHSADSQLAGS
jgi:hypothetical protein